MSNENFLALIGAWKPPSSDRSQWTGIDFISENFHSPIPPCFCGHLLVRDDRFCDDCGLSNPNFDEDQYRQVYGDELDLDCTTGHKGFLADIMSGEIEAPTYCSECGQQLFGPRLIK